MTVRILGAPRLLEKHRILVRSPRPCLAGRGDVLVLAFPRHGRYRRARELNQERPVSTMDPQGPNRPHHDPTPAEPSGGADHGAVPQQPGAAAHHPGAASHQPGAAYGAAAGQPVPEAPKKKRGKGMFIALGCGLILLIFVLIAGCGAIVALSGNDDEAAEPAASQEAAEPEEAEQEEAGPEEAPAEDGAADGEDAPVEEDSVTEDAAAEEDADEAEEGSEVPAEHRSALSQAESYAETMYMSKQGIFDQLVSEYGGQFSEEAAQYAVDTIDADWNQNALESAEVYSDMMHMSKQGIFDQLISEYGGQFTEDQAQYAIDTIDADWNQNALESAKVYQDEMAMSPDAIRDQLSSEYGDQFTEDQAQYAVDNL